MNRANQFQTVESVSLAIRAYRTSLLPSFSLENRNSRKYGIRQLVEYARIGLILSRVRLRFPFIFCAVESSPGPDRIITGTLCT